MRQDFTTRRLPSLAAADLFGGVWLGDLDFEPGLTESEFAVLPLKTLTQNTQ